MSPSRPLSIPPRASSSSARATTGSIGCVRSPSRSSFRSRSFARQSRSSYATSRRRARSSLRTRPRYPKCRVRSEPGTTYCWLRDAFFVIKALNRLGATQTMEEYIHYITNIAVEAERPLRPVYGIVPAEPLEERVATELAGFHGCGPVRVGNQASEQLQHDSYGSVILAASQMFIDERLPRMGDADLFRRLEPLGAQARRFALEPDAGPWEHRVRQRVHTHSATMCWVACDRLARIAGRLGLSERAAYWRAEAEALRHEILKRSWNESIGALAGA